MGYVQSAADPCIFLKYDQDGNIISAIGIFVDDGLVIGGGRTKYHCQRQTDGDF